MLEQEKPNMTVDMDAVANTLGMMMLQNIAAQQTIKKLTAELAKMKNSPTQE